MAAKATMKTDHSFGIVPLYKTNQDYEILLIQQVSGHWGFPKGHKEGDESDLEAATRELYEETGLQLQYVIEEVELHDHYCVERDEQRIEKTVRYFLGLVVKKAFVLQPKEIQSAVWVQLDEAEKHLTYNGSRQILRDVHTFLIRAPLSITKKTLVKRFFSLTQQAFPSLERSVLRPLWLVMLR